MSSTVSARAAQALAAAVVDGALAGVAAGVIDQRFVLRGADVPLLDGPLAFAIVIGLTALAGIVVGTPIILVARGFGRHPALGRARARLATPGPARVEALVGIVGGTLAVLAVAVAIAAAALAVGGRDRAPGASAALIAGVAVAIGLVVLWLATLALPPLARVVGRQPGATSITSGRRGAALLVISIGVVLGAVDAVAAWLAPAWDARAAIGLGLELACAPIIAAVGGAVRLGRRRSLIALALAAALIATALGAIGRAATARAGIAQHGLGSGHVLRGLWHLADGDGDGFSDGFGAHDCDDGDPRVHPHALDLAGDGVDGNCAGGDPDPAAIASARAARAASVPTAPHHDIVIVTIDSMRADHTSLAGYHLATTPNLAALATRAARFDRALSPSPLTRRALPAMLYGRMAATLSFSASRRWPLLLDNQLPTLASTLVAAGYRTAAIVSHRRLPLSDATYHGFAEVIGLSDELVSRHHDNGDAVIDRALAWLATPSATPRFLWIHLIDPHYPYRPPAAAPTLDRHASGYDRELAFADAQLGRLIAALSADRTVLAVTADHGEALGEHHLRFHGRGLDDGETHVPLVIAIPHGPASATAAPVTLIDLAPTLLDLVGVDTPAGMTGVSLAATVRTGAAPPARAALTELFDDDAGGRELIAVHVGDRKLIRDLAAWTVAAYDLAADPGERAPLRDPAILADLTRALEAAQDREQAALPPNR